MLQRLLLLMTAFFLITACGRQEYVSTFNRVVDSAQDPTDEVGDLVDNLEESEPETIEESQKTTLFEKVLENSDLSEEAVVNAFQFFDDHHENIPNQDWITIFDIKQHSGERRFYMINMETGDVTAIHTAHGKKSDLDHDGYATQFSNVNGSNQSSLGFMLTAETYYGKHGYSLRLDGLEDRNDNVRQRAIVIHGASYVDPSWSKMGRSLGCPAVSNANKEWVINRIKQGSLFYIYNEDYE